jgi:two-component system OmpR family response regulator
MRKKRILIVDDDVATTRLLKFGLERTGFYEVREENNGASALPAARAFKPDFIVLDVCMPRVAGGDVAAQFTADPILQNIPLVFLTSMVSEEEAGEKPLISGGYHFLAKPINLRRLVRYIESKVPNEPESSEPAPHGPVASTAPVS